MTKKALARLPLLGHRRQLLRSISRQVPPLVYIQTVGGHLTRRPEIDCCWWTMRATRMNKCRSPTSATGRQVRQRVHL